MPSKQRGNPMSEERQIGEPVQPAANEFAPNPIPGAGLVQPAATPEPSMEPPAVELSPEDEFLSYARGELSEIARSFGYEIVVRKIEAPKSAGPTMLYDPATREGRVFSSREDAPADYITMDDLRDLIAKEAQE